MIERVFVLLLISVLSVATVLLFDEKTTLEFRFEELEKGQLMKLDSTFVGVHTIEGGTLKVSVQLPTKGSGYWSVLEYEVE